MSTINKIILSLILAIGLSSCSAYKEVVSFPPSDQVFITSGDGNIAKPYEPMGEFIYYEKGIRLGAPLIGLIPIKNVSPDKVIREVVVDEVRRMGGNGLINMKIDFEGPKNGILGFGAKGGHIFITGTVIKM